MNIFHKYKGSYRQLIIQTPSFQHKKYIAAKTEYITHKQVFHAKNVKLTTILGTSFHIFLIGYDGEKKKTYTRIDTKRIIHNINQMPIEKKDKKKLSLYENYHPEKSIQGLGFKDKETALRTIEKIKDKPLSYQKNVIRTMFYRAKYHPHITKNMKEAMNVYQKWLQKYL